MSRRGHLVERAASRGPPGTLTQLIFTRCLARDGRPRSSRALSHRGEDPLFMLLYADAGRTTARWAE